MIRPTAFANGSDPVDSVNHPMHAPVITHIGKLTLEAPAVEGLAFLGRSGWVGVFCACGYLASGRSMAALEQGLADHQVPRTCPAEAEIQAQEALDT